MRRGSSGGLGATGPKAGMSQKAWRGGCKQAHNGSGKTTCFILGMLARVDPDLAAPQALCVCPTRELVVQNLQVLERMAKFTKITATSTANSDFEFSRCGPGAANVGV